MKIGIDARFLTHPQRGGFKTYTESLVAALAEVDAENEYILYLDRPPNSQTKLPNGPNFTTRIVPGTFPLAGMPWREQVVLARQVAQDRIDLLHSPCLSAPLRLTCPSVVTIHDMIWFFPEKFSRGNIWSVRRKLMEWYYRWIPQYAAKNAAAIITVSQAAKKSIVEHLKLDGKPIFVTHEAAGSLFRRINDAEQINAVRRKYHLPAEFILAIGSADPRKNIKTLVRAYGLLPIELRSRYRLVIVWTHSRLAGELLQEIQSLELTSQVQFLGSISNDDLVLIYNAAALFVFPSLYEGFGLPVLEAMACGTPVVAANNSSIPEIVGDAGLLVEAQDSQAMVNVIGQVLTNEVIRSNLIKKGLERSAHFSWTQCARQTIGAYKTIVDSIRKN